MAAKPVKTEPLTEQQQALVAKNVKLAYRLARNFCNRHKHVDLGDITGPALEGLCLAAQRYRSDRGASFASYAVLYIRGFITNQAKDKLDIVRVPRRRQKKMRQVFIDARSDVEFDSFSEWISCLPAAAKAENRDEEWAVFDVDKLWEALEATVTPLQYIAIRERTKGKLFKDIAVELGMTRQAVHNAYNRGIIRAQRGVKRV